MSTCYAFKDINSSECLVDHLRDVMRCSRSRWETIGLSRKLMNLYGVNNELVSELIAVSALLHDVGKADKRYQLSCKEVCAEFPNHYIFSTQLSIHLGRLVGLSELDAENISNIFDEVLLRNLERFTEGTIYSVVIVVPILLHHYAQINPMKPISSGLYREFNVYEDCLEDLIRLFSEVMNIVKTELPRKIVKAIYELLSKSPIIKDLPVIPLKPEHFFNLQKPLPQRFIIEAVLGILNLCDGIVASRNRRR